MLETGVQALTLLPHEIPGESSAGYLLRAFAVNGRPWSRQRLKNEGLDLAGFLLGGEREGFAAYLGPDASFGNGMPTSITKRRVVVAGQELHRDDWTTSFRQWCPRCWKDDLANADPPRPAHWNLHRRFWWEAAAIATCPIHAVRLERTCPTCEAEITWERGTLSRCHRGHSLLTCEPVEVDPEHTLADRYVVSRLGGIASVTSLPMLDGLELWQAHDMMERLGAAKLGGAYGALSKFPSERHGEVLSAGYAVAAGWPEAFDTLLDELAAAPHVGLGAWGAEQVYGTLYIWAKALPQGTVGDEVRDRLFRHTAARAPVHKTSVVLDHHASRLVSVVDVAAACGRSSATCAAYLKAMGEWPENTRRGTPVGIDPDVAVRLTALLNGGIGFEQLVDALGIGRRQTRMLVDAGFFRAMDIHSRAGARRPIFDPAEVDATLSRWQAGAPTVDKAPAGLVALSTAARYAKLDGIRGACGLLEEGSLVVRAMLRNEIGLAAMLVDPDQIRRERRDRAGGGLTLKEAGRRLGFGKDTVALLVRAGLVRGAVAPDGEVLVPDDAIDEFDRVYANTKRLASEAGTGVRWMAQSLRAKDLRPVYQHLSGERATVAIWRRRDVQTAIAKSLVD